ncbi:MAG: electron transfer flavoprotein subunit beta/FixA family protein [Planctomycetota bacterium]
MRVVVCLKQVPDSAGIRVDSVSGAVVQAGVARILNPFDAYALEEGVRLREKLSGECLALTMGPPAAEEMLREAIALGADKVLLVTDPGMAKSDTLATARALAAAIRKAGEFHVILTGRSSMDGDTAQLGPQLAEVLGIPHVTGVAKIREINDRKVVVERLSDAGREVVEASLPAVLATVKEINEPRLPSLKSKMKAKKDPVTKWGLADIGLAADAAGANASVVKTAAPPKRTGGMKWENEDSKAAAKKLAGELKSRRLI